MVHLMPDPFLNELTSMLERTTEKGSVCVTLKRSSMKSEVQRNKMKMAGEAIEYRCPIRTTDGKKTISTSIVKQQRKQDVFFPNISCRNTCFSRKLRYGTEISFQRHTYHPLSAVSFDTNTETDVEDFGVSSQFEDFTVSCEVNPNSKQLKVSVEVSGAKTRAIFNDVFDKMVAVAQPIPGFRRVKGGKIPNIPRDVLLEVLGPSKVYMEVIKKVINSTVCEYVEKEGLIVDKDLRVGQSFEDLEEMFEPDEKFSFDAVLQLQDSD